jgi:ElaB/YqjD/DUF883 family membrane-anchored ribosome-binding protein
MARNLEHEFDAVKEDLGKLRSDITSLTDAFQSVASEKVRDKWNGAHEKFDPWTEKARYRGRESLEDLAEEIEERPLTSIFLAFGVGVLLGRLFDR